MLMDVDTRGEFLKKEGQTRRRNSWTRGRKKRNEEKLGAPQEKKNLCKERKMRGEEGTARESERDFSRVERTRQLRRGPLQSEGNKEGNWGKGRRVVERVLLSIKRLIGTYGGKSEKGEGMHKVNKFLSWGQDNGGQGDRERNRREILRGSIHSRPVSGYHKPVGKASTEKP